jgi:NTP pyrophosphatase (non-canonical NTP hydrolase)
MNNDTTFKDNGIDIGLATNLILKEDERQIEKWGLQDRHLFEWLAYVTKELGELSEAISLYSYFEGNLDNVRDEAVQVATLAIKIAQMTETQKYRRNDG